MKKISLTFLLLIIISCSNYDESEKREPFEVNHNLKPKALLDNGYERIWGVDVLLFGKRINGVNVYYQIDLPQLNDAINDKNDHIKIVKRKGIVSFKNYQREITASEYLRFKDSILKLDLKIINSDFEKGEYLKDRFEVINLKTKDTFNCSLTNENDKLLFESSISIRKH